MTELRLVTVLSEIQSPQSLESLKMRKIKYFTGDCSTVQTRNPVTNIVLATSVKPSILCYDNEG
jgi:hypothetical protein